MNNSGIQNRRILTSRDISINSTIPAILLFVVIGFIIFFQIVSPYSETGRKTIAAVSAVLILGFVIYKVKSKISK